mmetsp:Transcript_30678/g.55861  ORF Transcript_30678/g.55861 Transcript_30678/m.55861 type:complete len:223 (-) Transcript_30678:259-927(-)
MWRQGLRATNLISSSYFQEVEFGCKVKSCFPSILPLNVRLFSTFSPLHDNNDVDSTSSKKSLPKSRDVIKFTVSGTLSPDFIVRRLTKDDVQFSFVRSSGAGGQNVNKVNTKVAMHWHVEKATWLPQEVRDAILKMERGRINSEGFLGIQAQTYRTQSQNMDDALNRIQEIINHAVQSCTAHAPDPESEKRATLNMRRANEKRLQEKKKMADRKVSRSKDWD